jgi:hypothetical protein
MTYPTIEKGIPIPAAASRRVNWQYPLAKLEIGDSFAVPLDRKHRALGGCRNYRFLHPGWDYTFLAEGEQLRIWRTA